MKFIKRDLPIYCLTLSLLFVGVTLNGNQANAASSGVSKSEFNNLKNDYSNLKNDYSSFRTCVQTALRQIGYYDAASGTRMSYFVKC